MIEDLEYDPTENHRQRISELMDPFSAKSPREWAAVQEIERLRAVTGARMAETTAKTQTHTEWSRTVCILGALGLVLWFILQLRKTLS